MLLEALQEEHHIADAVCQAVLKGRYEESQRLLRRGEVVQRISANVQELRETSETPGELLTRAQTRVGGEPCEHTMTGSPAQRPIPQSEEGPELAVMRRVFGEASSAGKHLSRRRRTGDKTPQREFRIPILEVLEQLGRRGRVGEVLDLVYPKVKDILKPGDLTVLSTGQIRWRNAAQWERFNMIRDGLLRGDSPGGIWEICAAGRAYLEQVRQDRMQGGKP